MSRADWMMNLMDSEVFLCASPLKGERVAIPPENGTTTLFAGALLPVSAIDGTEAPARKLLGRCACRLFWRPGRRISGLRFTLVRSRMAVGNIRFGKKKNHPFHKTRATSRLRWSSQWMAKKIVCSLSSIIPIFWEDTARLRRGWLDLSAKQKKGWNPREWRDLTGLASVPPPGDEIWFHRQRSAGGNSTMCALGLNLEAAGYEDSLAHPRRLHLSIPAREGQGSLITKEGPPDPRKLLRRPHGAPGQGT